MGKISHTSVDVNKNVVDVKPIVIPPKPANTLKQEQNKKVSEAIAVNTKVHDNTIDQAKQKSNIGNAKQEIEQTEVKTSSAKISSPEKSNLANNIQSKDINQANAKTKSEAQSKLDPQTKEPTKAVTNIPITGNLKPMTSDRKPTLSEQYSQKDDKNAPKNTSAAQAKETVDKKPQVTAAVEI